MKETICAYIRNTLGIDEQEVIDDLWQEYLLAFRENLGRIETLLSSRDGVGVSRAAHSLKGCAGNVGHTTAYQICQKLEAAGKESDFETAGKLLEQLQEQCTALMA
ncbi:MAG: Hpt domain-containing protein [Lentisphaerae bacterium]|nr:Hpt domain-containing protein [Lentisphaerota bacterium]